MTNLMVGGYLEPALFGNQQINPKLCWGNQKALAVRKNFQCNNKLSPPRHNKT